jgi:putative heme-binding domain-containing protein
MIAATLAICFAASVIAGQAPPDVPYPGSKLTRQQILDKLSGEATGTTPSATKGKEIYEKVCAGCHIFGDTGTSVGPDLTTLSSRFRKRDTLESILWPSKTISDQYAVTAFELTDGRIVSGVIVREDARAVYVKNGDNLERPVPVLLSTVKERTESTVSLMPENLVADLSLEEIDSLVAYVLSGK